MTRAELLISQIQDPDVRAIIASRYDTAYYAGQPVNDIFDVVLSGWDWGAEHETWSKVYESKNLEFAKELN